MHLVYDGEYFIMCQGQSKADTGIYYYVYRLLSNIAFIKDRTLFGMDGE